MRILSLREGSRSATWYLSELLMCMSAFIRNGMFKSVYFICNDPVDCILLVLRLSAMSPFSKSFHEISETFVSSFHEA
jgi:hypothetical protein